MRAQDLLIGLSILRDDEARLREWASVLLAVGDLSEIGTGIDGDAILSCIWDLSFGQNPAANVEILEKSLRSLRQEEGLNP